MKRISIDDILNLSTLDEAELLALAQEMMGAVDGGFDPLEMLNYIRSADKVRFGSSGRWHVVRWQLFNDQRQASDTTLCGKAIGGAFADRSNAEEAKIPSPPLPHLCGRARDSIQPLLRG